MAKSNITVTSDITIQAREVDFVTRFSKNWEALREILGIMRPIVKAPGTKLVSYQASMKSDGLQGGSSVGEGEEIPYTEFKVEPVAYNDIVISKYAKAVSIEAVNKYGASVAVQKTDEAFLNELQGNVLSSFYTFLNTGSLVGTASTFQMALAMAKGMVIDKFNKLRRNVTDVVGFVNVLDVYQYIGAASITVQSAFGFQYIKDFMGYSTIFLLSEPDIARGTVLATPVENIDLYYIDPSNSDFAQLGLNYTVEGETNLIGFHANGDYAHAVGESFALMGMTLWAEYLDGIAKISVNSGNLSSATVAPEDGSTDFWGTTASQMQSGVSVSGNAITGTLTKLTSGQLVTDWGEGYFLALKFSGFSSGLTYANVKVGLVPSVSSGLVTLDSDQNGVFKITDKNAQKFAIIQTNSAGEHYTQYFDLSGLTLS